MGSIFIAPRIRREAVLQCAILGRPARKAARKAAPTYCGFAHTLQSCRHPELHWCSGHGRQNHARLCGAKCGRFSWRNPAAAYERASASPTEPVRSRRPLPVPSEDVVRSQPCDRSPAGNQVSVLRQARAVFLTVPSARSSLVSCVRYLHGPSRRVHIDQLTPDQRLSVLVARGVIR